MSKVTDEKATHHDQLIKLIKDTYTSDEKIMELNFPEKIDDKDQEGNCLLHHAFENNRLKLVKYLIENKKADIDVKNALGYTTFHNANISCNLESIKILKELGANPNTQNNTGYTPFHHACMNRQVEIFNYLLNEKVDINLPSNTGNTPLMTTIRFKNTNSAKQLLTHEGCDVNHHNQSGDTALHFACEHQEIELIKKLLLKGAYFDVTNRNQITPLYLLNTPVKKSIVQFIRDNKLLNKTITNNPSPQSNNNNEDEQQHCSIM